jgi:hypothetical protein
MKKIILLVPFILMACGHEESNLEKELRIATENKAKADQEMVDLVGKEAADSMAKADHDAGQKLIRKADSLEALKKH